jgi:hypothetical protein
MSIISFEQSSIEKLSIHFVGNRTAGEQLIITDNQYPLNDESLYEAIKEYFFSSFKGETFFCFQDPNNAATAKIVREIFEKPANFHVKSKELAQYLYQCGTNKKIKGGEFYVTFIRDCIIEDEVVNGIGIFKSENKDTFIKIRRKGEEAEMKTDQGLSLSKLDKGCIIYDTYQSEGYKAVMVDSVSNINAALYWKTDFLGLVPVDTEYFMTNQYMQMMQGFSKDYLNPENEATKEDQLAFLQKSNEYFMNSEVFDSGKFVKEVIIEPEMAEAFVSYKDGFDELKHLPALDSFQISQPAVEKNSQKFFRSVIKLDKNFHVYVHGNANHLERGFDEKKKMHYYKLYYNSEE